MNIQIRDLVMGMVETQSIPCDCSLCGQDLDNQNRYSAHATICRDCSDVVLGMIEERK